MIDKPKLYIATPCYGAQLHAAYATSLLRTKDELRANGIDHVIQFESGDSLVQRARNMQVADFIKSDCTHMMFIDGDIGWEPQSVVDLLAASCTFDELPVVCGIYPRKSLELTFPVNLAVDANQMLTWHKETGMVEVKDAPTGFLMIRRDVIDRLVAAYPERACQFRDEVVGDEYALFDCFIDPSNRHYLSEDFGFSRLWQKIGGRIFADPNISLDHYGQFKYSGKLADRLRQGPPERAQEIEGWMTDEELGFLSGLAGTSLNVIEIGSWKGRSTFALLSACPGEVIAVDHWQGSKGELGPKGPHLEAAGGTDGVYREFLQNVGHFPNLTPWKLPSLEAAGQAIPADMVFIDGGHAYEEVLADIRAWKPKAKKILCGHDYNWPGVKQAVDELLGDVGVVGTIWFKRVA